MCTFADDIEEAAGGPIKSVVIGGFGWSGGALGDRDEEGGLVYGLDETRVIPDDKKGIVLPWEEARTLLNYEYDTGHGAPDCHAITAWAADRVIWVTQYDGATNLSTARRHPANHSPRMPGG